MRVPSVCENANDKILELADLTDEKIKDLPHPICDIVKSFCIPFSRRLTNDRQTKSLREQSSDADE